MRTVLIVMADVMVLLVTLLAVTEFHALKRYAAFTVPFTDRLIACGAIRPEHRERILREDRVSHMIGMGLCIAVWIMLSTFFAGLSGWALFPAGVGVLLALLRPGMEENDDNREQYHRLHRKYIDDMKYRDYLAQTR